MKNVKELRQSVEPRMKRCWGESCALFFISAGGAAVMLFAGYLTINILVAANIISSMNDPIVLAIAAAALLLMWIITVPYKYGARWYRLQQVRGHSVHAKSVFSCYFSIKRILQVYRLSAVLFLKKSVLLIPFVILSCIGLFLIIKFNAIGNSLGYNMVVVVILMLSVVVYLAYTIINVKYAAAPYLFALGHDRPAKEIIDESAQFMKGKHGYMIEVLRSCAFMLIPCVLVFPIVFVGPRIMMIYTAAVNEVIENGFAEDKLVDMKRRG